jgi:hypothetical protein
LGKVLIMGSSPLGASSGGDDPFRNSRREPLSDAEVNLQIAYLLLDIREKLGSMNKAVQILEAGNTSQAKDINGLGKVAHTAKTLGWIAMSLLGVLVAYLLSHVTVVFK